MATQTTGNWQKSLWPGVDDWFNNEYNAWETEYTDIFTTKPSDRQFEQVVGQSLFGRAAIKAEGDPLQYDDAQQTYVNQYDMQVRALGTKSRWKRTSTISTILIRFQETRKHLLVP